MGEQPNGRFAGKVAFVTGGGSGIGRAVVERFAGEGASVVVSDIDRTKADEVAAFVTAGGGAALAVSCDVTRSASVNAAMQRTVDAFGHCDIAHANAGIGTMTPVVEMSDEQWGAIIDVDLTGVFYTVRAAARQMLVQGTPGAILCTSSAYAVVPGHGLSPYCAAKSGVVRLVECASMELGGNGIRVNAIAPGVIGGTPMTAAQETVPGLKDFTIESLSIPRLGMPEDVAAMAAFLASDDASYVTGHTFYVDGGMVANGAPNLYNFASQRRRRRQRDE